jgi:hypothetical protein
VRAEAASLSADPALVERDMQAMHEVLGSLDRAQQRTEPLAGSRILLSEHLAGLADPGQAMALPGALQGSLEKIAALHPNLFPREEGGASAFPPVLIEPSLGHLRWLDDRFVLSFLSGEQPRSGQQLSLSALDCSVLRMFGQYLSSGSIYNYRGEKARNSFIADYSVAEETRAVVRYSGAEKRLTYGSASEVKDSASREEAEEDYMDFMFAALNGLPLPRRINQRRAGVLLRYCTVRDEQLTAQLVMRYLAQTEQLQARELLYRLGGRDEQRVAQLVRNALSADPQIAAQYRGDAEQAIEHVMGREFRRELSAAQSARPAAVVTATAEQQPEQRPRQPEHDYFGF